MKDRLKEIIEVLKENNITHGINPVKLCKILEELGPTFIKIGQILSTRVDLLPEEYTNELSKLRSNAIPLDFQTVKNILNESYGDVDKYFKSIKHTPIGSASIAQVHIAYLTNGEKVVIKIKRPGIDDKIKTDIKLLKEAVSCLHLNKFIKVFDFNLVLDELYNTTLQELDFSNEVNNLVRFSENNKDSYIYSPKVYLDLCRDNAIVMEYIEGLKINDTSKLIDCGYNLNNVALLLSENYIKQALDDGFFHADPHPDNIMVRDDKIVYIDLGMMGTLSKKNKILLKNCMKAIISSDYNEVARILLDMSEVTDEVDHMKLVNDIKSILINFGNSSLNDIDITKFIKDMFKMLQENKLILDNDVTMLVRGIGIIEAVLEKLDSNINLVEVLTNKIKKDSFKEAVSIDTIRNVGKTVINSTNGLLKLPGEVSNLITSISNGEIKFKVEFSDSNNHIDKLEKLLHELIITFLDGILIICLCFSKSHAQREILGLFVIVLSVWLLIKMLIDKMHNGY